MQWTATINHGFTPDTSKPWLDFSSSDPQISVSAQLGVKGTLLHYYQRLIQLRQTETSLRRGDIQLIQATDPGVLAYTRQFQGKTTVVVMNFGSSPVQGIALNVPAQRLTVLWGEIEPAIQDGTIRIPQIAAQSSAIIRIN
jgi:glycosidase